MGKQIEPMSNRLDRVSKGLELLAKKHLESINKMEELPIIQEYLELKRINRIISENANILRIQAVHCRDTETQQEGG